MALDAQLINGSSGGVQQFIIGLVSGLASLRDGDEEYFLLTYEVHDTWLRPYLNERFTALPQSMAKAPHGGVSQAYSGRFSRIKSHLAALAG